MSHDDSSNQTTPHVYVPQPLYSHPQPQKKNNPVTLQSHLSKPNTEQEQTFNKPSDNIPNNENNSLQELQNLIQQAFNNHAFSAPPLIKEQKQSTTTTVAAEPAQENKYQLEDKKENVVSSVEDDGAKTVEAIEESIVAVSASVPPEQKPVVEKVEASLPLPPEQVSIYGIPLLADETSDVILLKFLRARDFKVKEAFTMIKNTILWRKEFGIEELMDEKLGDELEKVVYMHGFDKEGHPVCYNIYGEFQNKELYNKTFSDEEKRHNFLKWRIQFLEKSIRNLDFNHGGVCTIVHVNDLKDSPGPGKWELRQATKQALQLFQDNYPEFVAKQVI